MNAYVQKLKTFPGTIRDIKESPEFSHQVHRWTGKVKGFLMNLGLAIILTGIGYIIISPLIGVISSSIMSELDSYNPMVYLIPINPTLENLWLAFTFWQYPKALMLSLGYSVGISLIHVVIGSMVGYGFARFRFPGSNILFAIVILTIVVPVQTYMVPLYINFRFFNILGIINFNNNLIGTYWTMILLTLTGVGLRSGLFIYIFRQFFKGLPKEIEEAALIDGAGIFRTYATVMMPNATSAILTVLLFSFVWHYNDGYYSTLLITNNGLLSRLISTMRHDFWLHNNQYSNQKVRLVVYAGVVLTISPVILIYFLLQRYFIEGIERSGIVG